MSELYSDTAVQAIQDSVRTEEIKMENGDAYLTRPVFLPPAEDIVDPLGINTLQGLVDYIQLDFDLIAQTSLIHVASPNDVRLLGEVEGRHFQRPTYVHSHHRSIFGDFAFGRFMPIEKFVISLQCLFEDDGDCSKVLALVGNIQSEVIQTNADDGVSQSVQVREGIRRVQGVEIENPVMLSPKRSFPEIAQTESPFILRLEKGRSGELPAVGLFECDGGAWRLQSIANIKHWLRSELGELAIGIIG
jgi:hypothetical protein